MQRGASCASLKEIGWVEGGAEGHGAHHGPGVHGLDLNHQVQVGVFEACCFGLFHLSTKWKLDKILHLSYYHLSGKSGNRMFKWK